MVMENCMGKFVRQTVRHTSKGSFDSDLNISKNITTEVQQLLSKKSNI